MRKFLCFAVGTALLCSVLPFAACEKSGEARCRYEIAAEYTPESGTLTAKMQMTAVNTFSVSLDELKFELWANAYRAGAKYKPVTGTSALAAYYDGESYGGMTVTSVTGGDGWRICGEDENILSVPLAAPLKEGESVTLGIDFTVTLAKINHRLGIGEHVVTLANFYPVLCYYREGFQETVYAEHGDPFVSGCADYTVELTVPKEYRALCSGPSETATSGDRSVYTLTAENVRDVAFVLGKELNPLTDTVEIGGKAVTVEAVCCSGEGAELYLKAAKESLLCYSELFGDYAYPRYTLVGCDFPYGGMEYPGLVLISSGLSEGDIPAVVAHETAHQWWYATVGSNQFEAAWQDEGLAEYSSALFLEKYPDYGDGYTSFVRRCEKGYRTFFSVNSQLSGADTAMTRPLTSFHSAYEYRSVVYDKGVILFDRVRSVAGDKRFFGALKTYFKTYAGEIAEPENLIGCFQYAGSDVKALFSSFLDGKCVI